MSIGNGSRPRRRAWQQAGRIGALLAIVIAGTVAIVHYSSPGAPAGSPGPATAAAARASTAARLRAASAVAAPAAAASAAAAHGAAPGAVAPARPAAGAAASSRAASSAGAAAGHAPGAPPGRAPAYFGTRPPGATLPSGAQCARWVRASPSPENKAANRADNHSTGQQVGALFFPAGDTPQAGRELAGRINGDFTGTTKDILRWAACKWGISQSVVFAQAAVESWWRQDTLGDWGADASACPPGHQPGADGTPGLCPQSYGILQNRFPYERASWPAIGGSTAMNADTAYAIWRSCYDGYEVWLNNVSRGQAYHAGDLWGCVGRWYAGRWHTAAAQQYIARVRQYQRERIWLSQDFQQG